MSTAVGLMLTLAWAVAACGASDNGGTLQGPAVTSSSTTSTLPTGG